MAPPETPSPPPGDPAPGDPTARASRLSPFTDAHHGRLVELLGEDAVRRDEASRERYGRDETEDLVFPPDVVALPSSTDAVSRLLAFAHAERLPVTPRGAGTGLSGGALPVRGGISLSLERLDRIRSIRPADMVCVAESGVVLARLQEAVEAEGLFYPPDPGSRESCFLGGTLAEDSAGPRSVKYGPTRRWVLGLEAVLADADGTVIETGGANRKDVAGYNLTQLLVGSEGTLAVITAVTLRLTALPAETLTLILPFDDLEAAAAAVSDLFVDGWDPSACEILEAGAVKAVGRVLELPGSLQGREALLLVELDGDDPDALLERAAGVAETAGRHGSGADGAGEALVARDRAEQRRLWAIRRKVGEAVKDLSVYKEADTVVPRSRLADLVRSARAAAEAHGLEAICYGHAGDGNLHVNLLKGDLDDDAWAARRDAAEEELFERVLALGGTVTAEHGIGWTQRRFLERAVGRRPMELMAALKAAFDPRGVLNPDKILPEAADESGEPNEADGSGGSG